MLTIKSPSDMALELAGRLRELRLQKVWSRKELSTRSGVSEASIKRFELTGQISLERLLQLSFTLEVLNDFEKVLLPLPARSMKDLKRSIKKRQRGRSTS